MHHPLAVALVVASVPIILALCRAIGPARAAPYAILGTFLILARTNPDDKAFGFLTADKLTIAGLSLALGILLFDRKAPAGARLHWVDAPMVLYVAAPLVGLLLAKSSDVRGSLDQSWLTFAEWGVPYAVGRLYFADECGPRKLSVAVVVAGLLYIPFCVFEMAMGKGWFLRLAIFGLPTEGEYRLGGWRPVVMMSNGLELVSWMALASVLATWLWACRERWRARYLPSWLPPAALIATTVACRGVYGYATLAMGLAAIGLLLLTRSRWALAPLLLIPVAYIGLRVSGAWDGQGFVRLAQALGSREASSVGLRLAMEDQYIRESLGHGLAFGLGGRYAESWADGWWLTLLRRGGLFAVACHYAAFLLPAALFVFRGSSRPVASSAAGLALFVILHMIDSLQNTPLIAVSSLMAGSLAGLSLVGAGRRPGGDGPRPRASSAHPGHATYRLGDLGAPASPARDEVDVLGPVGFALAVACLLYVFGHAKVEGQGGAKIIGGLGSGLLYASAGAMAAGSPRRPLGRVAAFGLAFGLMAITSNLAVHPSYRPVWMGNILQGMALSGVVVACWRRATGGGPLAYAALAALASTWWAIRDRAPVFPGSQYLYAAGEVDHALYPAVPWLALASLGALLLDAPRPLRAVLALVLGLAAVVGWGEGPPFGPPTKFPLNPTHALIGGSLVSAVSWLSGPALRWGPIARASAWLGSRWLVFFYVHLSLATALPRAGLTRPVACWAALLALSLAATWLISGVLGRSRPLSRRPWAWALALASTLAVGLWPRAPVAVVYAVAGGFGLAFASGYGDLSALILGPPLAGAEARGRPVGEGEPSRYLARVAVVVALLVAPELVARLPAPLGLGPRESPGAAAPDDLPGPGTRP